LLLRPLPSQLLNLFLSLFLNLFLNYSLLLASFNMAEKIIDLSSAGESPACLLLLKFS
jgi:hypothetical protein